MLLKVARNKFLVDRCPSSLNTHLEQLESMFYTVFCNSPLGMSPRYHLIENAPIFLFVLNP